MEFRDIIRHGGMHSSTWEIEAEDEQFKPTSDLVSNKIKYITTYLSILARSPSPCYVIKEELCPQWSPYVFCSGTLKLSDVPHLHPCWDDLPNVECGQLNQDLGFPAGQALWTTSSALGCHFSRFCVLGGPQHIASLDTWCQRCLRKFKSPKPALLLIHHKSPVSLHRKWTEVVPTLAFHHIH